MGLTELILGKKATYEVSVKYKCRNCGLEIIHKKELIDIYEKHGSIKETNRKIMGNLLSPIYADGYRVNLGHTTNDTFFPFELHECPDGDVGYCELSSFKITKVIK